MVEVAPFRGLRPAFAPQTTRATAGRHSGPKKVEDLSSFICPPYDVISPAQRAALVKKFPKNAVEVELPEGEAPQKYARAAEVLRAWKEKGILQPDRHASLYVLETTFRLNDAFAPASRLKRTGVLVALRLEVPGKGAVHPHERTLSKAREDRLCLLRALETDVSPIFGLFFDRERNWAKWIAAAVKGKPLAWGREGKDLTHRMWKIDDEILQSRLRSFLKKKDLYIADGHHRYEVAWAYSQERLTENPQADSDVGWNSVMAYVCPMEERGLLMLPTHRLVKSNKTFPEWRAHLEKIFEISCVKDMGPLVKTLSKPKGKIHVLGWVTSRGAFALKLRRDVSIERCLPHRPQSLRDLDVVLLHDLALGEAGDGDFLPQKEVITTRDLKEIARATKAPDRVAFLLGSAGVEALARVAADGEVMPPKTTYFYPKVPTGFTLMPLDQRFG